MNIKAIILCLCSVISLQVMAQKQNAVSLSQDMLTSIKMNQPIADLEEELAQISEANLVNELNTEAKKQAFWTNVYVVYSQKLMSEYEDCDRACKKQKSIHIAQREYSLNDILYRILLHSKCKVTGTKKWFVPQWEKSLRVSYPDGRILLAIDSHEKIVSAFTYYEPENMDQQLTEVSMIFLQAFVFYDLDKNEVYVPFWIKHFKREFSRKSGIISGLKRAQVIPSDIRDTRIIFSKKIATLK